MSTSKSWMSVLLAPLAFAAFATAPMAVAHLPDTRVMMTPDLLWYRTVLDCVDTWTSPNASRASGSSAGGR